MRNVWTGKSENRPPHITNMRNKREHPLGV